MFRLECVETSSDTLFQTIIRLLDTSLRSDLSLPGYIVNLETNTSLARYAFETFTWRAAIFDCNLAAETVMRLLQIALIIRELPPDVRRLVLPEDVQLSFTVTEFLNLKMRKAGWGTDVVRGLSHEQRPAKPKKLQDKKMISPVSHKTESPPRQVQVVRCFICQQPGHRDNVCPKAKGAPTRATPGQQQQITSAGATVPPPSRRKGVLIIERLAIRLVSVVF